MMNAIHRLLPILGVALAATAPATADIINVPAIEWNELSPKVLTFDDRIVLHANVRRTERYQVRFIRGTKEQIKNGWIRPAAGEICVRVPGTPLPAKIGTGLIDLGFPNIQRWIEATKNEPYVLVLEQINTPDTHTVVRLKPGFAATYIDRGLQVILQARPAPPAATQSAPVRFLVKIWETLFPSAVAAPIRTPEPQPPIPPPPPPSVAARASDNDCLDYK